MNLSLKKTNILLWILLMLFVLRVLGQLIVACYEPSFLPPMEYWYSGLMPYWLLLPVQIVIIILFFKINMDFKRTKGYFITINHRMGFWLRNFGILYFIGMIVRFFIQGISIPVVFHWVLAIYIIVLGCFHLKRID